MPYIAKPIDRDQVTISTLGSMVEWDSTARVIDHFVDCLDLDKLGNEGNNKRIAYFIQFLRSGNNKRRRSL